MVLCSARPHLQHEEPVRSQHARGAGDHSGDRVGAGALTAVQGQPGFVPTWRPTRRKLLQRSGGATTIASKLASAHALGTEQVAHATHVLCIACEFGPVLRSATKFLIGTHLLTSGCKSGSLGAGMYGGLLTSTPHRPSSAAAPGKSHQLP